MLQVSQLNGHSLKKSSNHTVVSKINTRSNVKESQQRNSFHSPLNKESTQLTFWVPNKAKRLNFLCPVRRKENMPTIL